MMNNQPLTGDAALKNSALDAEVVAYINAQFQLDPDLNLNFIETSSLMLLSEITKQEQKQAITEFVERFQRAKHKIKKSKSGYFRGVCQNYWKKNREKQKRKLIKEANKNHGLSELIMKTIHLLFTPASGLDMASIIDKSITNRLNQLSDQQGIDALYEFATAVMYRQSKIRNIKAYFMNILTRQNKRKNNNNAKKHGVPSQNSDGGGIDDHKHRANVQYAKPKQDLTVTQHVNGDRFATCPGCSAHYQLKVSSKKDSQFGQKRIISEEPAKLDFSNGGMEYIGGDDDDPEIPSSVNLNEDRLKELMTIPNKTRPSFRDDDDDASELKLQMNLMTANRPSATLSNNNKNSDSVQGMSQNVNNSRNGGIKNNNNVYNNNSQMTQLLSPQVTPQSHMQSPTVNYRMTPNMPSASNSAVSGTSYQNAGAYYPYTQQHNAQYRTYNNMYQQMVNQAAVNQANQAAVSVGNSAPLTFPNLQQMQFVNQLQSSVPQCTPQLLSAPNSITSNTPNYGLSGVPASLVSLENYLVPNINPYWHYNLWPQTPQITYAQQQPQQRRNNNNNAPPASSPMPQQSNKMEPLLRQQSNSSEGRANMNVRNNNIKQ